MNHKRPKYCQLRACDSFGEIEERDTLPDVRLAIRIIHDLEKALAERSGQGRDTRPYLYPREVLL